jgi:uncharacterized protein YqhQ
VRNLIGTDRSTKHIILTKHSAQKAGYTYRVPGFTLRQVDETHMKVLWVAVVLALLLSLLLSSLLFMLMASVVTNMLTMLLMADVVSLL